MSKIIEIKNVSFCYKGSTEGLLNNVSLSFEKGETVLLCGASGCGKTTLIRLMNGLIPHYYQGDFKGEVIVSGKNTRDIELYDLAGIVGTVFQNPRSQFFSVDTDGEIVFGPENIGLDPKEIARRSDYVVQEMNIKKLLGKSLFDLSGGEKQKIACASVSALLPEVILLDEPSSNLDWDAIDDLKEAITKWKEQGKTIIISEHRLWYLKELVDRVIYLDNGNIVKEWSGEDFASLDEREIKELKLRPVSVEESFIERFRENPVSGTGDNVIPEENAVTLKDFYFSYERKPDLFHPRRYTSEDSEILTLNIPELKLPKNSVIAVVGNNGAGKSTFLRCVCGLEKYCDGKVMVDGKEYSHKSLINLCYMVMQDVNHQLFTDSVLSEVLLSMDDKDEEKAGEILSELGLSGYMDKHPMALSGGQKQRVAIASAIAAGASLLLFDEPTSGLDYAHMEHVGEMLKELASSGKTVLVSTHDPELIEKACDHVLCINKGKVEFFLYARFYT